MQAFTFIYLLFSKWICKFFFKGRSLQDLSKIFAGSTVTCYLSNTFNTNFARFVILQFSRVLNNSHVKGLSPIYTGCYFSIANISFTFLVTANSDSSVSNSFLNTSASLESSLRKLTQTYFDNSRPEKYTLLGRVSSSKLQKVPL